MKGLLIFFLLATASLQAAQDEIVGRVHAHSLIGDYASAVEEAKNAVSLQPQNPILWETYISALAAAQDREQMMAAWRRLSVLTERPYQNRQLLEKMAWSIIEESYLSSSPVIRLTALLAAHFGNDARGVDLLCRGLGDPNTFIRAIALKLAGEMRDRKLCQAVIQRFYSERIAAVRWEAVRSLGRMKVFSMKPAILAILADERHEAAGKAAAIEAMVCMEEGIAPEELAALIRSPRAGLRQLACEVVYSFDLHEQRNLLFPLLKDSQPSVRASALRAVVALQPHDPAVVELIEPLCSDSDGQVAITASWAMALANPHQGQQQLNRWLFHGKQEVRLMAAAAVAALGKYGHPTLWEAFETSDDPYVKLTLAWGMITQRVQTEEACRQIRQQLAQNSSRWMWKELGSFRAIAPSEVKHNAAIPHYPEAVSQMVRLELLNALAIVGDGYAQRAVVDFLKEKGWGISATASALLLTECDESAVELVEELTDDRYSSISTQAALVLALWGRGESAVQKLQEAYGGVNRECKERILEGVGRVGLESSLPFLVERLSEPYPTLRVIAAASLLQCLNH